MLVEGVFENGSQALLRLRVRIKRRADQIETGQKRACIDGVPEVRLACGRVGVEDEIDKSARKIRALKREIFEQVGPSAALGERFDAFETAVHLIRGVKCERQVSEPLVISGDFTIAILCEDVIQLALSLGRRKLRPSRDGSFSRWRARG